MGFWDKITNEFIDIIEWVDPTNNTMVYRFPRYQNEIKNGAKLIVRESQVAILISEGRLADIYDMAGTYELTTQNMPILTTLQGWKFGFNSPFKAEVYFISTKNFTNLKWGTKNPVMLRDPEFGPVRLRAFGSYTLKIQQDPTKFLLEVVGTDGEFSTEEISEQLRNIVVSRFVDILGESKIPILDLVANYDELSRFVTERIIDDFDAYGLKVTKLLVENISLPPEVEAALDKRSSMGIIGNLNAYTQFQAANALEKSAQNSGGASDALNAGIGFAMANQFTQKINQPEQNVNSGATPPPLPAETSFFVAINGKQSGPYNMATLTQMVAQGNLQRESLVWKQGMTQWTPAAQVGELMALFNQVPPPLPGQ
jgi:membrane protease subunit (stomatin/prohibitin family)